MIESSDTLRIEPASKHLSCSLHCGGKGKSTAQKDLMKSVSAACFAFDNLKHNTSVDIIIAASSSESFKPM